MSEKMIRTIGIITHRGNYNYGGLLQALALQRWLTSQGFSVEIINLDKMQLSGTKTGRIARALLTPIKTIGKLRKSKVAQSSTLPPAGFLRKFTEFKISAKMKYSQEVQEDNIGAVANKYDAIIVGSDQVWCYKYARPLIFFAQWSPAYTGLLLSYAACSPDMDIPWYNRSRISKQLMRFDEVSVRDTYTMKWVESICGRQTSIVVDPTLLYDFNEFVGPDQVKEPYIFAYCLGSEIDGGHDSVIKEIRKQYGEMKVIGVAIPNKSKEVEKFADEVIYDASPEMWLNLLRHAAFVYTDSFHGCMFSLKYNKQFIAYFAQESRASRLIDLRDRYKLDNAIISSASELHERMCLQKCVDYEITNVLISEHVESSKQFLKESLCSTKE